MARAAGLPERKAGLNLRAVADVLESYGLDPIEEVAKAVMAKEPVVVNGQPVIDQDTGKVIEKHLLPIDLRVKTLIELAQYSRPKLKAVEVTVKPPELTEEQVERRLQGLLARQRQGLNQEGPTMPASQARTISADARHARVQRAALLTGAAPAPREAEETAVADELIAPVVADDTRATQGGDWISKLALRGPSPGSR